MSNFIEDLNLLVDVWRGDEKAQPALSLALPREPIVAFGGKEHEHWRVAMSRDEAREIVLALQEGIDKLDMEAARARGSEGGNG